MLQGRHLGRVGEHAGLAVHMQGVGLPARPVAKHHFHKFIRAVIALVMAEVRGSAEIPGFRVVQRGDDVPGRPTAQHHVQGGKDARHVEGLVVGGGVRHADAEFLRGHAHHLGADDRVHLHGTNAVLDGHAVVVLVDVRNGQPVVEERHMELCGLQLAREIGIEARRHEVERRLGVAPRSGILRAVLCLHESDQDHLIAALSIGHGEFISSCLLSGRISICKTDKY